MTRPTFYRHFPSKEDLVLAHLRSRTEPNPTKLTQPSLRSCRQRTPSARPSHRGSRSLASGAARSSMLSPNIPTLIIGCTWPYSPTVSGSSRRLHSCWPRCGKLRLKQPLITS
ncbi:MULTISPECIES: TetR/AcrR family transcriptional regulator [Streptomyces]|uniref:TetR/AcrR family transcriptional regulator n=1 Tax=Streptomyces TaxID=1883 RepID=UPI0027E07209|nr:helix-turn-helix domain-containing protein [Streptomyces plumbidurans]